MQNKINYDKLQQKILSEVSTQKNKPALLMHTCCAPCSTACLERVINYFNVTVYYYNPNITDKTEYYKRLDELKKFLTDNYCNLVSLLYEEFDDVLFYNIVKGYEDEPEGGKRCKICYALRLDKTAEKAKENSFDYFTTTLSVSPHKNADWLNELGENCQKKYDVNYLYADFKKQGGYLRSVTLSKTYNLYRQDYCGCEFSKRNNIKNFPN